MRRLLGSFLGVALLAVGCVRATAAETADDVALLAQKGLGEEVLLAFVERAEGSFTLSADQIIKLKQVGVPEKVIAAMLRKKAPAPAAPSAPAVQAAPVAQASVAQPMPAYEYVAPRTRIIRAAERVVEDEPLTTVVYRSDPVYVPTYYPSDYYWGYSSPFIFTSWGSSSSRWGWGGSFRSHSSFGRGFHSGGPPRGGPPRGGPPGGGSHHR